VTKINMWIRWPAQFMKMYGKQIALINSISLTVDQQNKIVQPINAQIK